MLTFGADPEVFCVKFIDNEPYVISPALLEKFNGLKLAPGVKYLSKEDKIKHPVYIYNTEFYWIQDGVAWELTIRRPLNSMVSVHGVIGNSLYSLREFFLNKFGSDFIVYTKPVVNINPDDYIPYLEEEKVYQGFIFGCDPDEDAILPHYKCETVNVLEHKLRYGGGHIHIGSNSNYEIKLMHHLYNPFVKLLAIHVGTLITSLSPYPKEDKIRVERYGMPGRFRRPPHGIEYRTPSNSWINIPRDEMILIEKGITRSFLSLQKPEKGKRIINKYLDGAVESIVNCNQSLAREIWQEVI